MVTDEGAVWITSDLLPDGTYAPAIIFDADTSVALTEANAVTYALSILEAAQAADYDAAVLRQLAPLVGAKIAAVTIARDIRPNRRRTRPSGTPLELRPGVSQATGEAFLKVEIRGKIVGQWSVADAREHALRILDAAIVADFDGAYYRTLIGAIEIPESTARTVVDDLRKHRDPPQ
jgi:hypothetical protein